ncbi:MAG: hypothetical protein ACI3T9_07730 [Romboutsia timonensis]
MENKDKLIQYCTCPVCKEKIELEYNKSVYKNMITYSIKVVKGCKHFVEDEIINENYARLLDSLVKNRQQTYDQLVNHRAKSKLQEMGLNKEDLRGLF